MSERNLETTQMVNKSETTRTRHNSLQNVRVYSEFELKID